jgi:mannose-6-phosphate isomerase-like protein (cupin superfamily)
VTDRDAREGDGDTPSSDRGPAKYTVAHIDDLTVEPDDDFPTVEWKPVRRYFGIGSFGCNLARGSRAGDVLTHDHTETDEAGTRHEELFLIVSGRATYRVDGDEIDAPAGTFLYVPDPATMRGVVAQEPGTVMLAIGAEPGAVFKPSDWDTAPLPG